MSSTNDIQNKWQAIYNSGLDLGAKTGAEQDAGYGGRYQQYANARIYWHPQVGTFEVHGGILTKYLAMGGTGINQATNNRDLGFPISDESWLTGDSKRISYFQWGAIYWVNNGRCIHGDLFNAYKNKQAGDNRSDLGLPVSDNIKTSGGEIAYFECGCLFKVGNLPVIEFSFEPPLIGNPYFAGTDKGNSLENTIKIWGAVSSETANDPQINYFKNRTTILNSLFSQKYCLKGVQSGDVIYLDITKTACDYLKTTDRPTPPPSDLHAHPQPPITIESVGMSANAVIPADKQLKNRELYNLCFALDESNIFIVSPHCIYAKDNWDNFGAVHVTDSHVATRYDWIKHELKKHPELAPAYPLFMNPNDNFRDFIKYANRLYRAGQIDVVIHTGDLVDYVFENNTIQGDYLNFNPEFAEVYLAEAVYEGLKEAWDWFTGSRDSPIDKLDQSLKNLFDKNSALFVGGGNFEWFIHLLMGRTKYADDAGSPTEELLVPILTTLGNHDYRPFANDPAIEVDVHVNADGGSANKKLIDNYQNTDWNLTRAEAIFLQKLWGAEFSIPPDRALSYLVHYYDLPPYYHRKINRTGSFVKKLGSNRLVLIDTKYDAGIDSLVNLIKGGAGVGSVPEDVKSVFQGGDTIGFESWEINMLNAVLTTDAGATGAVIVGIHAPAINPSGGEYNHYFRETEHAAIVPSLMRGYIERNVLKIAFPGVVTALNKLEGDDDIAGWIVSQTPNFKRGSLDDNLDNGAPYANRQQFWDACAGKTLNSRKVNLVLSGHIHKHTEWRTEWDNDKNSMNCYFDFYFENPSEYYSSTYPDLQKVRVNVVEGAALNGTVDNRSNVLPPTVQVPPNQTTLNTSNDPKSWWQKHSPVITQTACLGWMDYPQRQDPDVPSQNNFKPEPSFTGLRVITIQNNVISKVKFVNHAQIKSVNPPHPVIDTTQPVIAVAAPTIEVHDHRTH